MDSGYTMDEVSRMYEYYRMDNRFAYDDDLCKAYCFTCGKGLHGIPLRYKRSSRRSRYSQETNTELNEYLLKELAKECGVELEDTASLEAIEEKLNTFAEVSGKSRDAVVGFLNSLEEDKVESGIRYFGGQIAFENKKKDP